MKILAIDTSCKNCSVAIVEIEDNKFNVINLKESDDERTHSQKLMPMIDELFKESNLSLDNINLLACCVGPGSFTGIRIGVASIKAFADVKNIPVVGVTSIESLAYNITENGYIIPMIDAKNENIYSGLFYLNNDNYCVKSENTADNINSVLENFHNIIKNNDLNANIYFVGDGSIIYKNLISESFSDLNYKFCNNNIQSSISLAKSAYNKYKNGEYGDSNFISPIYLRKSQAERHANGEK